VSRAVTEKPCSRREWKKKKSNMSYGVVCRAELA